MPLVGFSRDTCAAEFHAPGLFRACWREPLFVLAKSSQKPWGLLSCPTASCLRVPVLGRLKSARSKLPPVGRSDNRALVSDFRHPKTAAKKAPGGRPWPRRAARTVGRECPQQIARSPRRGNHDQTGLVEPFLSAPSKSCLRPRAGSPPVMRPWRSRRAQRMSGGKRGLCERPKGVSSAAPDIREHDGKSKDRDVFRPSLGRTRFCGLFARKKCVAPAGAKPNATIT